jgi:prevent-host-death family protein
MTMAVTPVSALKANMPRVLRSLRENRNPLMVVSKGQPQAVIQDVASYQGTQDAITILKLMLHSEQSVAAGRGSTTDEVMTRLRRRVASRK